ncbi:MAG: citrate lyase subunit alpha [Thermoplasmata archaeon]|nr:citrate lyase subunit alpha [Thermoplasmata archaeon]
MPKNAVGRFIPEEIKGRRLKPFKGAFRSKPHGYKGRPKLYYHRPGKKKLLKSIESAIKAVGLKSGMTVSFHHQLRNGDWIVNMVLDKIAKLGIKNLKLATRALFPVHEPVIDHIRQGVITSIESSMNGPVGAAVGKGALLPNIAVLRSHGGRGRAIEADDLHIDVTFLGASECDEQGNCNGVKGKSAFGPIGPAWVDYQYADRVVIITDNLVPYPATPISVPATHVDYVVEVDSLGDPGGILFGTTKITRSPARLLIAEYVVEVLKASGLLKNGFAFQAGAGGISLAVTKFLHDHMKAENIVGNFAVGGSTKFVTDMLQDGTIRKILDAQCFDTEAINSLRDNPNHQEISSDIFGNPHTKGCVTHNIDVAFLGATEVDVDFNVNVVTHSDGMLLHGIGGHADAAAGARLTFVAVPLFRKRIPVIRDKVTTVIAPGETIDVVVTERGIAVNPTRKDLIKKLKVRQDLPITTIQKLKQEAENICGKPEPPDLDDEIVAIIEYRDGTVIDTVRKVKG